MVILGVALSLSVLAGKQPVCVFCKPGVDGLLSLTWKRWRRREKLKGVDQTDPNPKTNKKQKERISKRQGVWRWRNWNLWIFEWLFWLRVNIRQHTSRRDQHQLLKAQSNATLQLSCFFFLWSKLMFSHAHIALAYTVSMIPHELPFNRPGTPWAKLRFGFILVSSFKNHSSRTSTAFDAYLSSPLK